MWRKGSRIKSKWCLALNLLTLVLAVGFVLSFVAFVSAERGYDRAMTLRVESLQLVEEMQQTANDLTSMALQYLASGNERFRRQYAEIRDIQAGRKGRPVCYGPAYWDSVIDEKRPCLDGPAIAWEELMSAKGLAKAELAALEAAQQRLGEVVLHEQAVMSGHAQGLSGGTPEGEATYAPLSGPTYTLMRSSAARALQDFSDMVDRRTNEAVREAKAHARATLWWFVSMTASLMLAFLRGFLLEAGWRFKYSALAPSGTHALAAPTATHKPRKGQPSASVADDVHPIASKLIRWIVFYSMVCAMLISGIQGVMAWRKTNAEFDSEIENIGRAQAALLSGSVWDIEAAAIRNQLQYMVDQRSIGYVRLRAKVGEAFEAGDARLLGQDGVRVFDVDQPGKPGEAIARLEVVRNLPRLYSEVAWTVAGALVGYGALTTLICILVRIALRNVLERPLRRVADFVRHLSPQRLTTPLVIHRRQGHARDEIDLVVDGFRILQQGVDHHIRILDQRVEERTRELALANEQLQTLSVVDALTGIYNRRKFEEVWRDEYSRAMRQRTPLAVVLLDVDHFKDYNDHYGHQSGDACLKLVAQVLSASVNRSSDLVARYGGEEFVLVLPGLDKAAAESIAQRLRKAVLDLQVPHAGNSAASHVTVSAGVAAGVPSDPQAPRALLEQADSALYRAKHQGRNQVVVG